MGRCVFVLGRVVSVCPDELALEGQAPRDGDGPCGACWAQCWRGKNRAEPLPVTACAVTSLPNARPPTVPLQAVPTSVTGNVCHFLGDSS